VDGDFCVISRTGDVENDSFPKFGVIDVIADFEFDWRWAALLASCGDCFFDDSFSGAFSTFSSSIFGVVGGRGY
jgi:hypothetical protein